MLTKSFVRVSLPRLSTGGLPSCLIPCTCVPSIIHGTQSSADSHTESQTFNAQLAIGKLYVGPAL